MQHQISARDYEGYGVYEHSNHDASLHSMGAIPSLAALQQVETINGLSHVPTAINPAAKAALDALDFQPIENIEVMGVSGVASFNPMSFSQPWVDALAARSPGQVVMIQRSSIASGNVNVLATSAPLTVVLFAGVDNSDYVIIAAAPGALAAAEAAAAGGISPGTPLPGLPGLPSIPGFPNVPGGLPGSQPQGSCPAGSINVGGQCFSRPPCPAGTDEILGACFPRLGTPGIPGSTPVPGFPEPPPGRDIPLNCFLRDGEVICPDEAEPKKAGLPSWVVPAVVGGGLAALVFYLAKK